MIANRASGILRPVTRNMMQRRNFEPSTVVSGPPTVHVPFAEKLGFGVVMFVSWIATPMYILSNIKNYRGQ